MISDADVLFVGTNHGRKLMLAQRVNVIDDIFLLILTPASFHKGSSDDTDRSFLADLYHWETILNHLSQHCSILFEQLGDVETLFLRLLSALPNSYQKQMERIWHERVSKVLRDLSRDDVERTDKKRQFNSNFSAFSKVTEAVVSRVS